MPSSLSYAPDARGVIFRAIFRPGNRSITISAASALPASGPASSPPSGQRSGAGSAKSRSRARRSWTPRASRRSKNRRRSVVTTGTSASRDASAGALWAVPRGHAGPAALHLRYTREHTRQGWRVAPTRRAEATCASPGEDLGGRGVDERGVGALVQGLWRRGSGDRRAGPGGAGLRGPAAAVGRRTDICMAGAQSPPAHRLRTEGANERDPDRGRDDPPAPATACEDGMTIPKHALTAHTTRGRPHPFRAHPVRYISGAPAANPL